MGWPWAWARWGPRYPRLPRPSAGSAGSFAVRRGPPAHPPDPAQGRGHRQDPGEPEGIAPCVPLSSLDLVPAVLAPRPTALRRLHGRTVDPPPAVGVECRPSRSRAGPRSAATRSPYRGPGHATGNRSTGPSKSREHQAEAHAAGSPSSTGTAAHVLLCAGRPHGDGPSTTAPETAVPDAPLPRRPDRVRSDPPRRGSSARAVLVPAMASSRGRRQPHRRGWNRGRSCKVSASERPFRKQSVSTHPPTDDESFFLTGSDPAFSLVPLTRSRPMTGGACSG